jgi:transcriptional pleiotropic regulator of transition state genes
MKSIGIVRKIDDLGRVVLPKELRRTLGINEGDPLEIFTKHDLIILKKYNPGCAVCGCLKQLKTVEKVTLCKYCVAQFIKGE